MRLCLFTPNFLPAIGGAERMADALARGLTERGHHVVVLAQRHDDGEVDVPYPVLRYRRPPLQHLWPEVIGGALRRAHRAHRFDVVLAFYAYPTGYVAARVRQRLGVGVVIATRGGDLYPTSHLHRKLRVLSVIRRGYRGADRIVSLSRWMTRRLNEVVGEGLPPIEVIPNGIDLDEHDRLLAESRDHRPDLPEGVDLSCPFALHLATLTPVKRHAVAIEAVAHARPAMEAAGAQYLIAGDGQCRDELAQLIARHDVGHIAKLIGWREGPDRYALLARAKLMVSTSMAEGLPNVLLEAMASGLPGLVSDIDPHVELTEGAAWAERFKLDDVEDLAEKLRAMIGGDVSAMAAAARAQAQRYSLREMIDRYEAVCQSVGG